MPSSLQARMTRRAISPRFAINILLNKITPEISPCLNFILLLLEREVDYTQQDFHCPQGFQR